MTQLLAREGLIAPVLLYSNHQLRDMQLDILHLDYLWFSAYGQALHITDGCVDNTKKSRIRHGTHPGINIAGVPEKSAHSRISL